MATEAEVFGDEPAKGNSEPPKKITSEADLAEAPVVRPAGMVATPKEGTAPAPGIGSQFTRQLGLTARNAGPYAGSALAGAGMATMLLGPEAAPFGAVAGPTALALTDLGTTVYNAIGPRLGGPTMSSGTELFDKLLDKAGVPRPETPGERIVQSTIRAAAPTAASAKTADVLSKAVTNPTTAGVLSQIAANPTAQTLSSGVAGGTTQAGIESGLHPVVANLLGMITGVGTNVVGQRVGNAMSGNYTPEGKRAMDLNAAAKREGVTLTAGDLGNRTAASIENFLQDVPLSGRDAFMQQQAAQTKTMLERLRASIPSGDAGKETIDALRTAYDKNRSTAGKFYDAVNTELAAVPGSDQLAMTSFQAAAKKFLKEYPKYMDSPDTPQSVKDALQYAASGNLPYANYQLARDLRTMIGQEVRAAERAGKTVKGDLSQLFRALSDDFRDWSTGLAQTNPKAATAYGQADKFFKENVVPFKADAKIKKIVGDTTTADELDTLADGVMKNLFKLDSPGRANFALKLTGKPGESIAQGELVNRALTPALDQNLKAGVSPMRFVNTMNLQDPMVQAVVGRDPALASRLQTISDISQAARRAPTAFETPRTGVQNKALGTAVGLANPVTTLPTAAGLIGGRAVNRALQTDPVKGFLFANGADPYSNLLPLLNAINGVK